MKNKALKSTICGLVALVVCFSFSSFKTYAQDKPDTGAIKGYRLKTIIIDPGHGGAHPSEKGHYSNGAHGEYSTERGVTLAVGLKLQAAIEKELPGVRAILTRTTEEDVDWQKRADIANQNKGDLFLSLHCNAMPDRVIRERVGTKHGKPVYKTRTMPDRSARGVLELVYGLHRTNEESTAIRHTQIEAETANEETFDPNDPVNAILINEYKRKFRKQSITMAGLLNNELVTVDGRKSDGVLEQGILVLCHTAMPSTLLEMGFIDNPDDEAYMNSEKGQDEIIQSIIRSLKKYRDGVDAPADGQ